MRKIKFLLLLSLMCVMGGGMNAFAETKTLFYESFDSMSGTGGTDGSFSGSVASKALSTTDCDNDGWTITKGYAANKCIKLGTKSVQGSATTPTIQFESGVTYTISFNAGAWSGDATTLNISTTAGALSAETVTMENAAFGTYTVTLTATGAGTITFQGKQANKARFFLDEVKVTYDDGAAAKTATKLAFENSTYTFTQGAAELASFTGQTATLTDAEGSALSGEVTYASDNTDVATVDASTGKVTIADGAYGSAKITATYAGDDTYSEATASYKVVVMQNLTVAQAITELEKDSYNKEKVRITGIISKIDEISTSYGNATYYISDDGTTDNQLEVYRGYGLNGDKFTSTGALHVGDKVVVLGYLTIYNSTKEVNSGSSIERVDCPHVVVTVGATGYATLYYGTENLTIPEGVTAYTVTVSGEKAILNAYSGSTLAKGTGVVLAAEAGTYNFTKTDAETTAADAATGNLLKGSDEEATTEGGDVYYKLSLDADNTEGTIGFYYGAENGAAFTNGAHKAYLALTTAQANGIRAFLLSGDSTTGIRNAATTTNGSEKVYDLQGRRVQNLSKGLYIINGKKVIKK